MQNRYTEHYMNSRMVTGIRLHYCGIEQCEPLHLYGPAMRDHYLLHYIVKGSGVFTTGGCDYTLQAGDSFCMFPNRPSSYRADAKDPWTYYWIGFDGPNTAEFLELAQITEQSPTHTHAVPKKAESLFAELLHYSEADDLAAEAYCLGLLLQMLSSYMNLQVGVRLPSRRETKSRRDFYITQAIKFIEGHYQKRISIPLIAKQVGLERAYFTKLFQAHMGVAPYEFLQRYRIEKAILLLSQTNLSMQVIANSVGFDDAAYFGKAFARQMGHPPTSFRKHNQTPK
jgi:AraC-like DNA-binding protein